MNIKDHGTWHLYKPAKLPQGAPANAMFARRAGDGEDWYDYANSGGNFVDGTVKMTVVGDVVMAAVTDPTMLFPGGATVLEASDVPAGDPQEVFGGKIYDAASKTFSKPSQLDPGPNLAELLKRIETLEAKGS